MAGEGRSKERKKRRVQSPISQVANKENNNREFSRQELLGVGERDGGASDDDNK